MSAAGPSVEQDRPHPHDRHSRAPPSRGYTPEWRAVGDGFHEVVPLAAGRRKEDVASEAVLDACAARLHLQTQTAGPAVNGGKAISGVLGDGRRELFAPWSW